MICSCLLQLFLLTVNFQLSWGIKGSLKEPLNPGDISIPSGINNMSMTDIANELDIAWEMSYSTPFANSPLLPLLLRSIMGQKNAPETRKTFKKAYDYIIVGAGSAGSVVASRLSEKPCVSILLLEAGRKPPYLTEVPGISRVFCNTDIDWKYKTAPQKHAGRLLINRQLPWPSGKALGGSSVLNAMLFVRGNPKNYDHWAAEGAEGWSYKDVFPYFVKLEDNRDPEFVANGYHGIGGPASVHRPRYKPEIQQPIFQTAVSMGYRIVDSNANKQSGFYRHQATLRAGQRCSTAKAYLVPAENRTNLDILLKAMVRKVIINNGQAVGVKFDYEGKTYSVNARKEVIMSAGAINTPQLLMLSGIGPKEELEKFKIPVIADLPVGKNLQDHCAANVNFELNPNIEPFLVKLSNPLNIIEYIQNRTGPLGSNEFLAVLAFLKKNLKRPKVDFPNYQLVFSEALSELGLQTGLTAEAYGKIYAPYEGRPFYACFSCLVQPKSRGTVTLRSADPYDPPIIDPNYFEDPRDIKDLVDGLKVCNRICGNRRMQQLGSKPFRTTYPGCEMFVDDEDALLKCQVKSIIFTLNHQCGTARMGNITDLRTVVDPQLRVKYIKGLRVVDASVMPIVPSGNTNIPTIMVAEKASDIIKATINCSGCTNCKRCRKNSKGHSTDNVFKGKLPKGNDGLKITPWNQEILMTKRI